MLLVIHNLPSNIRYVDVKTLIKAKCGLTELILDNLVHEGGFKKVTVGLAHEEDAALLMRHLNGVLLEDKQLYVEDLRQKKAQEQSQQSIHIGGSNQTQQASINPWQTPQPQQQQQGFPFGMGFNPYMQQDPAAMMQMMSGMYFMQPQNPYMDYNEAQQSSNAPQRSRADQNDCDDQQQSDYYEGQGSNFDSYNRSRDWRENESRDRRSQWPEQQAGSSSARKSRWEANNEEQSQQRYRSRSPQYREPRGGGNQYQDYPNRSDSPDYQQRKPSPSNYYSQGASSGANNYSNSQGRPGGNNNSNSQRGYSGGNDNSRSQRRQPGGYNNSNSHRDHPGGIDNSNSQRDHPGGINNSNSQRDRPGRNNNYSNQNYDNNRSSQSQRKWEKPPRQEQDYRQTQTKRDFNNPPQTSNRPLNEKPWSQPSKPSFDKNSRSQQSSTSFGNKTKQQQFTAPAANAPRSFTRGYNDESRGLGPQKPSRPEITKPEAPKPTVNEKRKAPPKVSSYDVILRKNETWRLQATSKISKEIKAKYEFPQDTLFPMAEKALKKAIHTRIDLVLQGDMGVPMETIVVRYRKAFPPSGDLAFYNAVMENLKKDILKKRQKEEEEKKAAAASIAAAASKATTTKTEGADASSDDCVVIEDDPVAKVEPPAAKVEVKEDVTVVETQEPNSAPGQGQAPKEEPAIPTDSDKGDYKIPKRPKLYNHDAFPPPILPKYPHGDKQVYKEQKKTQKQEYKNDNMYVLEPLRAKALDEQMDKFCAMFLHEINSPADESEQFVCDKLRSDSIIYFRKALRLNIIKRILNIRTNLIVRVFAAGRPPKANDVRKFLKKFGIISIKKSHGKKLCYVANLGTYESYDQLILHGSAPMNPHTTLIFKPFQLAGPKIKLKKTEMERQRQNMFLSRDDYTGDDFLNEDNNFDADDIINDIDNQEDDDMGEDDNEEGEEGNEEGEDDNEMGEEGNFEEVGDNYDDDDGNEQGFEEIGEDKPYNEEEDYKSGEIDDHGDKPYFEVKDEDFEDY